MNTTAAPAQAGSTRHNSRLTNYDITVVLKYPGKVVFHELEFFPNPGVLVTQQNSFIHQKTRRLGEFHSKS